MDRFRQVDTLHRFHRDWSTPQQSSFTYLRRFGERNPHRVLRLRQYKVNDPICTGKHLPLEESLCVFIDTMRRDIMSTPLTESVQYIEQVQGVDTPLKG